MNAGARSGDKVLMTNALVVGYPDAPEPLFDAPDITLWRGEVAALIGANGVGKSTFVKTAIGDLPPLGGEAKLGASVRIGYFAQAHESLNEKNSVLDEITEAKPMPISEARAYLGQYLFSGDDVFRPISSLSGGERGRVALAKLALSGANFLLLDEPTNHLDIESQEILQNVLADFEGTILMVSHDRYLIDALATQIWAVAPGDLRVFDGTYKEYLEARAKEAAAAAGTKSPVLTQAEPAKASAKKQGLNPFQLQKRIDELEAQIEALEARLHTLSEALSNASATSDADKAHTLGEAYMAAEAERDAAIEAWAALAE
jgi:ATP-binding cassette subfamily F protein 3